MSLSAKIRDQIINSFRTELAEHIQTINQGLLALEQNKVSGAERVEILTNVFRAAHSLKGAARAVNVTAIEQLAHALEDVLGGIQRGEFQLTTGLFTACYRAVDAIQTVQSAYEAGQTTPPAEVLEALVNLDILQKQTTFDDSSAESTTPKVEKPAQVHKPFRPVKSTGKAMQNGLTNLVDALEHNNPDEILKNEGQTIERKEKVEAGDATPVQIPPTGNIVDETIRVDVRKLDSLMAQLSELLITKIHADQLLSQILSAREFTTLWQKEWLVTRNSYNWLERQNGDLSLHTNAPTHFHKELAKVLEYVNFSQGGLRDLSGIINNLVQQHQSDVMQMSLVIDRLEDDIKRLRMLPLKTITDSFGRMVRDLAQTAGKNAVLEIRGGEVELDKSVLEKIKDPIIHLLRNAVDHGIELPDKRIEAGKPAQGTIILSAEAVGREVAISITDDGSGLDLDAIRQSAIRRGMTNVREMTNDELVQLIYLSGFSTSSIITDVSGRGIGLDIVRKNTEQLHGEISIDWKPGIGTRFTLTLPLTLTSSHALLVRASDQWFAIPLNTIERILYIQPDDVTSVGTNATIRFEGQQIMLIHLSNVLELRQTQEIQSENLIPVVVLSYAARRMAFIVDELGDEQEVVVKALGKPIVYLGGIAGAHLMGNGSVLLVLNVADLIKLALRSGYVPVFASGIIENDKLPSKNQKRNILIVDDSITTRTLEKNILEASGYDVQLAIDGIEALDAIKVGELPDLIISDVVMPRLGGFDLAKRIKSEKRTAKIPLILVTSLDSPEDKARGIESGADAFIVKSRFDQENLLETIQQLI
jgi:two-component system, chemotaxis family, sensor kinase CheA